jgi:hypothetical protein
MNKTEADTFVHLPQQSMPFKERLAEGADGVNELFSSLAIMMDVHFNVSDTGAGHFRERVKQLRVILLLWVEKSVRRRTIRRVPWRPLCNFRPTLSPSVHSAARDGQVHAVPKWLVVIGDRKPDSLLTARLWS